MISGTRHMPMMEGPGKVNSQLSCLMDRAPEALFFHSASADDTGKNRTGNTNFRPGSPGIAASVIARSPGPKFN
jgi:hypothetical protein